MRKLHFPEPFRHHHPPVKNINEVFEQQLTTGLRASDWVAKVVGSWPFIIVQSCILTLWVVLNVIALMRHWDPYPFILMNLVLSLQAAYTAPIIMMSQNRQAEKDRLEAHNDYVTNVKAEEEIRAILEHLAVQGDALRDIHEMLIARESGGSGSISEPSGTPDGDGNS